VRNRDVLGRREWLSRQPVVTEPKSQFDISEKLAAQEKAMIEAALRQSGGRVFGPSGSGCQAGHAKIYPGIQD